MLKDFSESESRAVYYTSVLGFDLHHPRIILIAELLATVRSLREVRALVESRFKRVLPTT